MTQADLAEALSIPPQSISQWETGARNPKFENLKKIAEVLNIDLNVLYGTEGQGRNPAAPTDFYIQALLRRLNFIIEPRMNRKGFHFGKVGVGEGFISVEEYIEFRTKILDKVAKIADEEAEKYIKRQEEIDEKNEREFFELLDRFKGEDDIPLEQELNLRREERATHPPERS